MSIDTEELRALSAEEKLRLVEWLWDDLGALTEPIPLPDWLDREADKRRRELLADPSLGLNHDEVWRRIERRNG